MTLLEKLEAGDLCLERHPSKSGDHATGDQARAIVGRYWTKGDLVQMTAVLIGHIRQLEAENAALKEGLVEAGVALERVTEAANRARALLADDASPERAEG